MSNKKFRTSRAFSMVEMVISLSIFSTFTLIVWQFQSASSQQSERVYGMSDAMRSVMLATEFVRYDLGRALVHDEASAIVVDEDGQHLSLTISDEPDKDFAKFRPVRIEYQLEPVPGKPELKRLYRRSPTGRHAVKECFLTRFSCRYIDMGEISPHQAYLELELIGTSSSNPGETFVSSQLIPVAIPIAPVPYVLLDPKGETP